MSGSHRNPPREFHFFPLLPPEIRLCIWDYSLPGPRVVPIRADDNASYSTFPSHRGEGAARYISNATIPVNLHVCQESREAAMRVYGPRFPVLGPSNDRGVGHVFFDYSRDILYFGARDGEGASSAQLTGFLSSVSTSELANVQYVAVNNELLAISSPAGCPDRNREGGAHHRHLYNDRGGAWWPTRGAAMRNDSDHSSPENRIDAESPDYLQEGMSPSSSSPVSLVSSSSWLSSISSEVPNPSTSSSSLATSPYLEQPASPTLMNRSAPICCCCCSTAGGGGGGPGGLAVEAALSLLAFSFPRLAHLSFVFKDRNPIYSSDVRLVSSSSIITSSNMEEALSSSYDRFAQCDIESEHFGRKEGEIRQGEKPLSESSRPRKPRYSRDNHRTFPLVQDRIAERAIKKALRKLEEEQEAESKHPEHRDSQRPQEKDGFGSGVPRLWLQRDGDATRQTDDQTYRCPPKLVTWNIEFLVAGRPPSAVAGFERAMIGWGRDAVEAKRERMKRTREWMEEWRRGGQRREDGDDGSRVVV